MVRSRGEKIPFKFGGRRYRFRLLGSAKTREEKIRVFSGGGKFTRRPVHCDVEYDRWNATRKEWAPMSLSVTKKNTGTTSRYDSKATLCHFILSYTTSGV